MQAVGVHPDVIVVTSRVWQTTATAVRSGDEAFLIDSPVYPDELEILPAMLEQAGFRLSGLLVTHADWDHLLGRLAFPELAIGCAESTASRLRAQPGAVQRELRAFDDEHYVGRPRPLSVAAVQALPVPGYCGVGERELELHATPGHTADGMAVLAPWANVLCAGDYLSPVEIPIIGSGGGLEAYESTLAALAPLVERAETVVPGHGAPLPRARALELLEQDLAYVQALAREGDRAPLPGRRSTGAQKAVHRANARRVGR